MPLELNATLARLLEEVQQRKTRVDNLKAKHAEAETAMDNARNRMVELRRDLTLAEQRLLEASEKYTTACIEERNRV
jgi:chromosome segregation ATPase